MSAEQDDNKRQAKRETVLKAAKIVFGDSIIDCVVQNVSARGARIRTAVMVQVPDRVTLRFNDGTSSPALRRWARGNQIGFEFDDDAPLREMRALLAWSLYQNIDTQGLKETLRLLRAADFFEDPALRTIAERAEAAHAALETALKDRSKPSA